jgi:putative nucleotidyltransferase with HDIG domain
MIDEHLSQEVSSGCNRKVLLKLGGLLHDIAKPRTKFLDEAGRAHFFGHAKEGANMAAAILERLRFSNREIDVVKGLVYHHLHPVQMANEGLPTKRAIYRYFRNTDECGIDILFLALADYMATYGPLINIANWRKQCQLVDHILTEHAEQQTKIQPIKLVTGHDLINIFGLSPGPLIGELLTLVHEAQASGELANKQEALALVQKEMSLRQQRSTPLKAKDS